MRRDKWEGKTARQETLKDEIYNHCPVVVNSHEFESTTLILEMAGVGRLSSLAVILSWSLMASLAVPVQPGVSLADILSRSLSSTSFKPLRAIREGEGESPPLGTPLHQTGDDPPLPVFSAKTGPVATSLSRRPIARSSSIKSTLDRIATDVVNSLLQIGCYRWRSEMREEVRVIDGIESLALPIDEKTLVLLDVPSHSESIVDLGQVGSW
ncbi:unnamed protein product [Cyprideis torosa]|uniref:Uncharacterized protein n=1 Tax=Cyprideis torosa TaxID=163714 RepID=A0A7R8WIS4_9CRUS|nr:unnamed protein product [Cyprideis torosa]CAG0899175.1 unnamed protein product [Cyprideis torosa]